MRLIVKTFCDPSDKDIQDWICKYSITKIETFNRTLIKEYHANGDYYDSWMETTIIGETRN